MVRSVHSLTLLRNCHWDDQPPNVSSTNYANGLDLIIIQARLHVNGKTVRKITEVAEIAGMEGTKPRLNVIWKYNPANDRIEETGIPSN